MSDSPNIPSASMGPGSGNGIPESELSESSLFVNVIQQLIDAVINQSQSSEIGLPNFLPFLSYCYSWYGITCMAMAILLNRTLVIASTNTSRAQQINIHGRNRELNTTTQTGNMVKYWSKVLCRMGVIGFLIYNAYHILITLNVTSLVTGRELNWFFMLLQNLSIFHYDPETFHNYRYMKTSPKQVMIGPTTDVLWPVFINLCLLAYVETFIATIEGEKPYTEAGLTIFEHSLAFQEASSNGSFFIGNVNTVRRPTEELLVVTLFLILNHLNIQIGALVNRNKYRLIPSSIIGVGFLCYFTNILYNGKWLKVPFIIFGSILPQIIIVVVILVSLAIFIMAILATGLKFQDLNYASLFMTSDHGSTYQENQLIKLSDDFYTTLLNLGMLSITVAGKSSYITELSLVAVDDETWVERNLWQLLQHKFGFLLDGSNGNQSKVVSFQGIAQFLKDNQLSGYSNIIDHPSMKLISGKPNMETNEEEQLNSPEKISIAKKRIFYVQEMLINMFQLLKGLSYKVIVQNYYKLRGYRGGGDNDTGTGTGNDTGNDDDDESNDKEETTEQYEYRKLMVPQFLKKFVKHKVKKTPSKPNPKLIELDDYNDHELDDNYLTLIRENEFSEIDNSMDYEMMEEIELELDDSDVESITETKESITETKEFLSPEKFIEFIDEYNIDILQSHLKNDKLLTRSQFQNKINNHLNGDDKDDATKLIEIIIAKRMYQLQSLQQPHNDIDDDFLSDSKLDCVICQVNTREIITWPCKCFSICESCRLTLAAKGIEGCVCCRRDVEGVSRVFIP